MQAKIILSLDGRNIKEYPISKDRITIGRKTSCDISIDNPSVSSNHAALITMMNDTFLEDQNSTNGVKVNGMQVKKHFLVNGDSIEIGRHRLKYVKTSSPNLSAPSPQVEDFERTMVIRPSDLAGRWAGRLASGNGSGADNPGQPIRSGTLPRPVSPFTTPLGTPMQAPEATHHMAQEELAAAKSTSTGGSANPGNQGFISDEAEAGRSSFKAVRGVRAINNIKSSNMGGLPEAQIQILSGPGAGEGIPLLGFTTIGIAGAQVIAVTGRKNGYFVTHIEGKTLPSVNGDVMTGQAVLLNDHDVIDLGGIKMEFYFKE